VKSTSLKAGTGVTFEFDDVLVCDWVSGA